MERLAERHGVRVVNDSNANGPEGDGGGMLTAGDVAEFEECFDRARRALPRLFEGQWAAWTMEEDRRLIRVRAVCGRCVVELRRSSAGEWIGSLVAREATGASLRDRSLGVVLRKFGILPGAGR